MAYVVAAAAHDVNHSGQNNAFHVATQSEYAIQYSDQSVMEMHHLAVTFRLLQRDDLNIFYGLTTPKKKEARRLIIDMILATDLGKHFQLINDYKLKLDSKENSLEIPDMLQIALKAADIGHAVKPVHIHQKWTELISEEFFLQGDMERELGMEVPQFMDRTVACIPKSQIVSRPFFYPSTSTPPSFNSMTCISSSHFLESLFAGLHQGDLSAHVRGMPASHL